MSQRSSGKTKTSPQNRVQNRIEDSHQGPDGRFLPGNRANPGGRPRELKELKHYIQLHGFELVEALFAVVRGEPRQERRGRRTTLVYPAPNERVLACKELLNRGYGRPVLAVEMTGRAGGPLETRDIMDMTSGERRARLNELMAKAGAIFPHQVVAEDDGDDADAGEGEENTDA